ncbi:Mur ligase domain-containing protein [Sinomicrobium sp.]
MRLHCVGLDDPKLFALACTLGDFGYELSRNKENLEREKKEELLKGDVQLSEKEWWLDFNAKSGDGLVIGAGIGKDNQELKRARDLGLPVYTVPEVLYELTRNKTRVVIAGGDYSSKLLRLVLHVMKYHNKSVDAIIEKDGSMQLQLSEDNEFVLLAGSHLPASALDPQPQFYHYHPNIAWLTSLPGGSTDIAQTLTDRIVKGGIVVYNEDNLELKAVIEASENPIRKHSYGMLTGDEDSGELVLDTPEGPLPLEIDEADITGHLLGAKWLCQHLGIDEDDFYDGIYSYENS